MSNQQIDENLALMKAVRCLMQEMYWAHTQHSEFLERKREVQRHMANLDAAIKQREGGSE